MFKSPLTMRQLAYEGDTSSAAASAPDGRDGLPM
jgi:hypothetical protein